MPATSRLANAQHFLPSAGAFSKSCGSRGGEAHFSFGLAIADCGFQSEPSHVGCHSFESSFQVFEFQRFSVRFVNFCFQRFSFQNFGL
jgi:hypothetical protein